jgi:hypothetical protein
MHAWSVVPPSLAALRARRSLPTLRAQNVGEHTVRRYDASGPGIRSMPRPVITEGCRRVLLTLRRSSRVAARRTPHTGPEGGFSAFQTPGLHSPRLAAACSAATCPSRRSYLRWTVLQNLPKRGHAVSGVWFLLHRGQLHPALQAPGQRSPLHRRFDCPRNSRPVVRRFSASPLRCGPPITTTGVVFAHREGRYCNLAGKLHVQDLPSKGYEAPQCCQLFMTLSISCRRHRRQGGDVPEPLAVPVCTSGHAWYMLIAYGARSACFLQGQQTQNDRTSPPQAAGFYPLLQ